MRPRSLRPFLPLPALRRRPLPQCATRNYAIQAPGAPTLQVFNSQTKLLQRERAASDAEASRRVDYLRDEVASRLCERLLVCTLNPFKNPRETSQSIESNSIAHYKGHKPPLL